jgi:type II secretory pathway predicted ATPase ExeA
MYNNSEENAINQIGTLIMAKRKIKFTKPPPIPAYSKIAKLTMRELGLLDLDEHPFHISADPRFLYLTEQHKAALSRLENTIEWREGLSVIEGPIGAGKTILARRLYELCMQNQGEGLEPVYIHTASYPTPAAALRDIVNHYRLESRRAYLDKLRDFEKYLISLRKQNKNPVLIIDDAQLMASNSLQPIQDFLNFDVSSKLIQIILFGQQEIHKNFTKNPALLDRVVFWHRLGPLTYAETVRMIQFRLTVAGRIKPLFSDRAIELLYEASRGVPRPLMIICNETLHILAETGAFEADEGEVHQAIENYNQRSRSEDE